METLLWLPRLTPRSREITTGIRGTVYSRRGGGEEKQKEKGAGLDG
jgi:hypothetical protein